MSAVGAKPLRLVTWNIHGAIGMDRVRSPARIAQVLAELDADVVALQEVPLGGGGLPDVLAVLRESSGAQAVAGMTFEKRSRRFGNAVLTRWPVQEARTLDLTFGRHEPRGALDVDILFGTETLRIVATHLGLSPRERRVQIAQLLETFDRPELPVILAGDINEWLVWGRALRMLVSHFRAAPAPSTFPSFWPLLSLDRIWMHPGERLLGVRVHRSAAARVASDHLPLVAEIAPRAAADETGGSGQALEQTMLSHS